MYSLPKCWFLAATVLTLSACGREYTVTNYPWQPVPVPVQTISGTLSGLSGSGLIVQNMGDDDLALSANGSFTFAAPLVSGSPYNITVLTQPISPGQTCSVTNGMGTMTGVPVTNVQVTCVVMGDVNGDGGVDHKDAILAQRIALSMMTATPDQIARGDIYADGTVDISDYLLIQKRGLGL